MPFLAIAGQDYWVLETGAEEPTPEEGGQSRRAINGSLRGGVTWTKRTFRFQLEPLTPAAYETLQAAHKRIVAVTGDAVPDGDYELSIDTAQFERTGDAAYKRGALISLRKA